MKPTLLILAAGMGSRYGGLKQLDGVGPSGETIMDYSVYDAARSGFGKVVFIIRRSFREDFEQKIASKYKDMIEVGFVEQELDKLPDGFPLPPDRVKPWGTGHAMLMASGVITTPFAVINADDYYGANSFEVLGRYLGQVTEPGKYSMVGFHLNKTLSESGGVSRGICSTGSNDFLTAVEEHHNIIEENGRIMGNNSAGERHVLDGDAYTSMNMWGFTPDIFEYGMKLFTEFLSEHGTSKTSEFYIPYIVNSSITHGKSTVKVLKTHDKWFGVTYKEDREFVTARLAEMTEKGVYPSPLFP